LKTTIDISLVLGKLKMGAVGREIYSDADHEGSEYNRETKSVMLDCKRTTSYVVFMTQRVGSVQKQKADDRS
jgi:hypothetical protein